MNYTLIDHFNGFQSMLRETDYTLSASAQITYYTILAAFNAARFPAELRLSNRELLFRAGLKSVDTVHQCKLVLKNHKLIDFRTERRVTVYTLLPPFNSRPYGEHKATDKRPKGEHPYREFTSSSDCYPMQRERENQSENQTPRAREGKKEGSRIGNDTWLKEKLAKWEE